MKNDTTKNCFEVDIQISWLAYPKSWLPIMSSYLEDRMRAFKG